MVWPSFNCLPLSLVCLLTFADRIPCGYDDLSVTCSKPLPTYPPYHHHFKRRSRAEIDFSPHIFPPIMQNALNNIASISQTTLGLTNTHLCSDVTRRLYSSVTASIALLAKLPSVVNPVALSDEHSQTHRDSFSPKEFLRVPLVLSLACPSYCSIKRIVKDQWRVLTSNNEGQLFLVGLFLDSPSLLSTNCRRISPHIVAAIGWKTQTFTDLFWKSMMWSPWRPTDCCLSHIIRLHLLHSCERLTRLW